MQKIELPTALADFVKAHSLVVDHWKASGLKFTLDGRLVGDIAEVVAAETFNLLFPQKRIPGVDLLTQDGCTVQIKASGINKGPAFTPGEGTAKYLIFMLIDFADCSAKIIYNGLEAPVRGKLPAILKSTKRVPLNRLIELNETQTDRVSFENRIKK